jgi:hypothetical protein
MTGADWLGISGMIVGRPHAIASMLIGAVLFALGVWQIRRPGARPVPNIVLIGLGGVLLSWPLIQLLGIWLIFQGVRAACEGAATC